MRSVPPAARRRSSPADLADPAALRTIIPAAAGALGPVTLLVNNASVFLEDAIGGLDFGRWQTQFDTNLRAPVFLAEAFATQLPEDCEGNIVNMIDQRVWKLTSGNDLLYALQIGPLGGDADARPGACAAHPRQCDRPRPDLSRTGATARQGMLREVAGLPLKRRVDPADFGRAIRFLVETPSITGQMLALDSGQHLPARPPAS